MSRLRRQSVWLKAALVYLFIVFATLSANAACVSTTVSTQGINFGVISFSQVMITGTITLTCMGDENNQYAIALSTGRSNTYAIRQMNSGANTLNYNLYADAAYTQIWGDGTGGSTIVSGNLNVQTGFSNRIVSHTVYGRVSKQAPPAPGIYTDTIIVTIAY